MKKLLKICFAFTILFFSFSCEEDFLDKEPSAFLTPEQIADAAEVKPEILESTITGAYKLTFTAGTGGTSGHDDFGQKGIDIYMDMLCGDMALSQSLYGWYRTDITEFKAPLDYTINTGNYVAWRYYYRIIRSVNLVIDGLGGNNGNPTTEKAKAVMGQAKALRAHSYFYLTQLYQNEYKADQEILPIYTSLADQNGPKVKASVIYDLIVKDLNESIVLLNNFTRANKSQINKEVAKTILAYALAAKGDYAGAYTAAKDVIDNGGFTAMRDAELTGGFNQLSSLDWMWGVDLNTETNLGLLSFWGQIDYYSYSYAGVGDYKAMDANLFAQFPATDKRKAQFNNQPSSATHLLPLNKFYDAKKVKFGAGTPVQNDIFFYRISEVHLLAAECAAKSGNEASSKSILKNFMSLRVTDPSYVDGLSGVQLQNHIYLQTKLELWGEGKSYLAMKRNKATVTRGANHLSNVGIPIPHNDERLTFEIPNAEIQNNPFISSQND
jgi:hypothetical protein